MDFLCSAFDAVTVPTDLNKGESPQKRSGGPVTAGVIQGNLEHTRRTRWTTEEQYIEFRLDSSKKHRMCSFSHLQAVGTIDDPVEIRSKKLRLSEGSQGSQESQQSVASSKRKADVTRRWCVVCSDATRVGGKLTHKSRLGEGYKARRTAIDSTCALCHAPLCSEPPRREGAQVGDAPQIVSCFDIWHTCRDLNPCI